MPPGDSPTIHITVLGVPDVRRDGVKLNIAPGQERTVLALLTARAGAPVRVGQLVSALWGEHPPASAANIVHRSIGRIRRLLEPGLAPRDGGRWLVRAADTYRLVLSDEESDLGRFRALARAAENADDENALRLRLQALRIWAGPCADGVDCRSEESTLLLRAIDAERSSLATQAAAAPAHLFRGTPAAEVLREAAAADPLNEPLHAGLTTCLAAAGHRAEALAVVDQLRRRLAEELGVDPGEEIQQALQAVLAADVPAPESPLLVTPMMLPGELTPFVARSTELARLDTVAQDPGSSRLVVIHGMAGVGKTTLAVRWARANSHRFPDGELFADLRGFSPEGRPLPAEEMLRTFLAALGVPAARIPESFDELLAQYRRILRERRVLVILDNAHDENQVRPLLPPGRGSMAVVTSRDRLTGLVATQAAVPVALDVYTAAEAREALLRRLGDKEADRQALDAIVDMCAGLPLALGIVAARLLTNPAFTAGTVAEEMQTTSSRLTAFEGGDVGVRASLYWSYEALSGPAQRCARLAAVHRGYEGSLHMMASICALPPQEMRPIMHELTKVRLLEEPRPGRYRTHDMVCLFSYEICQAFETDASRRAARERLLEHYLASLAAAKDVIEGIPPRPPSRSGVVVPQFRTAAQVRTWYEAERPQIQLTLDDLGTSGPGSWESLERSRLETAVEELDPLAGPLEGSRRDHV